MFWCNLKICFRHLTDDALNWGMTETGVGYKNVE